MPRIPSAAEGTAIFHSVMSRPPSPPRNHRIRRCTAAHPINQRFGMSDMTAAAIRIESTRAEWHAITRRPRVDLERFTAVKTEADDLVNRGLWTSGPSDMLSVLGRQRDELIHSRLIAWLLVPTN